MRAARVTIAILVAITGGCSDSTPATAEAPAGSLADLADLAGGPCAVDVANPADEGASHTDLCAPISYVSKPPSSGAHYPAWPLFRVYDKPVPWGYLMHGMEHGAVVVVYNCPSGCPDQIETIKAMVEGLPPKAGCSRPPVIVTPDPTLDVPFAAAAWRYTLRAQCLDRERFTAFIQRRADKGPERIPSDCGSVDREVAGWCP